MRFFFFSAEGEVYFSRFPSFGCCIKLVGLALVTDGPVFLTILKATTFPTLNTIKNQKKNIKILVVSQTNQNHFLN